MLARAKERIRLSRHSRSPPTSARVGDDAAWLARRHLLQIEALQRPPPHRGATLPRRRKERRRLRGQLDRGPGGRTGGRGGGVRRGGRHQRPPRPPETSSTAPASDAQRSPRPRGCARIRRLRRCSRPTTSPTALAQRPRPSSSALAYAPTEIRDALSSSSPARVAPPPTAASGRPWPTPSKCSMKCCKEKQEGNLTTF
jgi:hypothetical protein